MSRELSLYNLTEEMVKTLDYLYDDLGEIDENKELKIKEINELITQKTDNVAEYVQFQKDLIEAAEKKIEKIKDFIKKTENGLDRLDVYVAGCMDRMAKEKLEGSFSTITRIKPKDTAEIVNEELIPVDYLYTPEPVAKIDKKLLLEDLKKGKIVPGAKLGKSSLSIKYKLI